MVKRTGPTNPITKDTIIAIERMGRKGKSAFWTAIARRLSKPRRIRAAVNLTKIAAAKKKHEGKWFAVPGKVLSGGIVEGAVNVVALEFSKKAAEKIRSNKGKTILWRDAAKEKINPSETVILE